MNCRKALKLARKHAGNRMRDDSAVKGKARDVLRAFLHIQFCSDCQAAIENPLGLVSKKGSKKKK